MITQTTHQASLLSGGAKNPTGILGTRHDFLLRYSLHRTICTARSVSLREISPDTRVCVLWTYAGGVN
jgi:hypothetical protein